jgi:hypothetical protein
MPPEPRIGGVCMVVLAVSSEPLSSCDFPANREFYKEIGRFAASFARGAGQYVHNPPCLACLGRLPEHKRTGNFFEVNRGQNSVLPVRRAKNLKSFFVTLS